jgi:hypothetical protein
MFVADFRDDVRRIATLVDSKYNRFEVLVEKINNNVYLTWGWLALKEFYGIFVGAWIRMVYTERGKFGILLSDRFGQIIDPPIFQPPMNFKLETCRVGLEFVDDLLESTDLLEFAHESNAFGISYEKELTYYDISTGFLVRYLQILYFNICYKLMLSQLVVR